MTQFFITGTTKHHIKIQIEDRPNFTLLQGAFMPSVDFLIDYSGSVALKQLLHPWSTLSMWPVC